MQTVKHPARFTDSFIPIFADLLKNSHTVLDPFAGTGKLSLIKEHGFVGQVICNELESEFVDKSLPVDMWHFGDAEDVSWCPTVDAICTSPTYGNRMADSHNAKDGSHRVTYTHRLGRKLTEGNTGSMQWGEKYRQKHQAIYKALCTVLKEGGLFILNVSNHIRKGEEIDVVSWHRQALLNCGLTFIEEITIETPRMRFGQNGEKRIQAEKILVFAQ